ncbi:MAG: HlyC/CorC family transporter [Spirochaetes bacterium]|uniref:HlyC/CorC family transporter n=1 Tax=Candidatus Ornithospirochaeta stercoripullorum TaxID=2840899 RepID=A0A9D9H5S5_9SPIO|nr:HlyC/CorC family transporter [Candidatus Ornithospirochaeta stercoripullorum]
MMSLAQQILLQIILILINAFFAATEIAVISLNTTKLKKLADEGDKYAPRLLKMAENPSGFLSTIQIGITLAGFLGSAFAADNLAEYILPLFINMGLPAGISRTISVIIITLIISFFTLIFGELVPKRIAQQKAFAVAKFSSGVISVTAKIMRPVVWLLSATTNLILRIFRLKEDGDKESVTEDDIKLMVDAGGESGSIEADEKEWIQNVFEFNDINVSEIMTREPDVVSFQVETPESEILETIKETGLSRFPVYDENINDILGILNARDFLISINSGNYQGIRGLLRSAYMVPDSIHADKLFSDMQARKTHIAIVVDEYGQTVGIVTLEDLLEEIVGNIYDEFDPQEEAEIQKIGEDEWKVNGSLSLSDFSDATGIELEENEDYDTIGGMVLSTLSQIPEDGTTLDVTINGLDIHVTKIEDRRIEEAIIRKAKPAEEESKEEENQKEEV